MSRHDLLQCASQSKRVRSIPMSLLKPIGFTGPAHFPRSLWAPSTPLSTLTTSWLTASSSTAKATSQGERMSGSLASSTPLTSYEPKFDVEINHEYTSIIFPSSADPFEAEQDFTTDVVSEDGSHQVPQASSSRQAVASTVFTVLNEGSTASNWKQLRNTTSVVSVQGSTLWSERGGKCENVGRKAKTPQKFRTAS